MTRLRTNLLGATALALLLSACATTGTTPQQTVATDLDLVATGLQAVAPELAAAGVTVPPTVTTVLADAEKLATTLAGNAADATSASSLGQDLTSLAALVAPLVPTASPIATTISALVTLAPEVLALAGVVGAPTHAATPVVPMTPDTARAWLTHLKVA